MRKFEVISTYLDKDIKNPRRQTKNSAAYDLKAAEDIVVPVFKLGIKPTLIPTGLKAKLQKNEWLMLVNRSSGPKNGLVMPNSIGVIDSDYYNNPTNEGHIFVQCYNISEHEITIKKGDRICQAIFMKYLKTDDDDADGERTGGFGSTGN